MENKWSPGEGMWNGGAKNVQKLGQGHTTKSYKAMIYNSRAQLINATLNTTDTRSFMNE